MFLERSDLGYGVDLIRKGNHGAKQCLKILNSKGGHIGMLIDQKMNDGISTKFFGETVKSPSAIAKFALKFIAQLFQQCVLEKILQILEFLMQNQSLLMN